MSNTRYAIIHTANIDGSLRLAPLAGTMWVRRISTSLAPGTYGMREIDTTDDLAKALTWVSHERATHKAAQLSGPYATYEARPIEVVGTYLYDRPDAARRHAIEVGGVALLERGVWRVLREQPAPEPVSEHTHTRPVPEGTTTGISGVQFRAVLVETSNPYLAERLPVAGYVRINEFDVHGGVQPSGAMFMPDVAEGELTSFVQVPDARFEFTTRPVVRG